MIACAISRLPLSAPESSNMTATVRWNVIRGGNRSANLLFRGTIVKGGIYRIKLKTTQDDRT